MDGRVLLELFGADRAWHGPCQLILSTEAAVESVGGDSLLTGGVKVYAPRLSSCKLQVDALAYLPDQQVLVVVQQTNYRLQTGEAQTRYAVLLIAIEHVVAIESQGLGLLDRLGLPAPTQLRKM